MSNTSAFEGKWWDFVLKSVAIGFVATEALDRTSILLYENEDKKTRIQEDNTRGYQAYEKVVDRIAKSLGYRLDDEQIRYWGWKFHKAFGIFAGFQFLALRRIFPGVGRARGALFGTGFFLVVDEFVIYLLKLSPGPLSYSWKVHARGAVSHLAYGIAAESTARALDQLSRAA